MMRFVVAIMKYIISHVKEESKGLIDTLATIIDFTVSRKNKMSVAVNLWSFLTLITQSIITWSTNFN